MYWYLTVLMAHRRKTFMKLFRLLICGEVDRSLETGGGARCALELDRLPNFDIRGSDFLWVILVSSDMSMPFSFTAIAESSGPWPEIEGVMTALASVLALEVLRESWMLLFALETADLRELFVIARLMPVPLSSACCRSSFSISPSMVMPLMARLSSWIGTNLMMPRSGVTPIDSHMNCCIRAALRLFVVGCSCTGKALMVRTYVGSKEPPSSRHAEWLTVIMMEVSGLWYLVERWCERSVTRVYSSLICLWLVECKEWSNGDWTYNNVGPKLGHDGRIFGHALAGRG